MSKQHKWLTASCFFPMRKWNLLLTAINNFISTVHKNDVSFFNVELNYENGDNIRLSILTPNEKFNEVREYTDNYFTNFFNQFPEDRLTEPVTSIHLPYPSAIIRLNSFSLPYNEHLIHTYALQQIVSSFMIDVFQHDVIDLDTTSTFYTYLYISLYKVILSKLKRDGTPNPLIEGRQDNQLGKHNENDNYILIKEIADDILQHDEFDDELTWLNDWVNYIGNCLTGIIKKGPDNEKIIIEYYQEVRSTIAKQLGISEGREKFLSEFIEKAVKEPVFVNPLY